MPVLLKSGQSASREEAVEEMKDCRSTVLKPYLCIEFLQPLAGHRPMDLRWKEPWFPGSPLKGTQKEGSNLNYVIVVVDEHDELPEATQREAEIQRQIDDLQGQITGLHRTREETHPELSLEFQILKEKLNEHSKQLEQSAEKLSQLELENLTLRDENQSLNAANKKRRFRTWVRPMSTLETPNSETGANPPTTAPEEMHKKRPRMLRPMMWRTATRSPNLIRKHQTKQQERSLL
ncbi:hypothetical protein DY000_02015619 [Brassica cretica]|uniref:Uncharacterized protein n=1 Tax=Brassica cretica TaxID=69181 RepID=A0ABQ7CXV2_BRACR|nr:hypothetical protein DY000_02015619 [Brassica cretica]